MADRYEINHEGHIVVGESALCDDIDNTIVNLFSRFGWTCVINGKKVLADNLN